MEKPWPLGPLVPAPRPPKQRNIKRRLSREGRSLPGRPCLGEGRRQTVKPGCSSPSPGLHAAAAASGQVSRDPACSPQTNRHSPGPGSSLQGTSCFSPRDWDPIHSHAGGQDRLVHQLQGAKAGVTASVPSPPRCCTAHPAVALPTSSSNRERPHGHSNTHGCRLLSKHRVEDEREVNVAHTGKGENRWMDGWMH